MSGPVESA